MASRYWVGGTASWDGTAGTKWALTSGGAGGQAVPGAGDNVFFDAASGAVTVTVATVTANCLTLDFNGFTGTFAGSVGLNVSGGWRFSSGMTVTYTGSVTFNGTSSFNITSNGKSFAGVISFSGTGGSWVLQDNFTCTSATTVTHTRSTLDFNGFDFTCRIFTSSNTNGRTIAFGSTGRLVLTGNNNTILVGATLTGLVITGTPVVNANYNGSTGTRTFQWGSSAGATLARAVNLNITAGTDIVLLTGGGQFGALSFTGFAGTLSASSGAISLSGSLTIASGMTYSSTATLTFNGTSGTQVITSNGKSTGSTAIVFNGVGGTFQIADSLTAGAVTLTNGTLSDVGSTTNFTSFVLGSGTKTLTIGSSGYWTISGSGTSFDAATNVSGLTVSASTATIEMSSGSAKTFAGGGNTWPTLKQGSGSGVLTITGANTFADITGSVGHIALPASTTTTVSALTYGFGTLKSSSAGTPATISKSSGTVSLTTVTVTDSTATGGATFNSLAANGCVDGGGNTGWIFGTPVNCYWVGGTASWDGTPGTKWAATSGGAGGQPIPTVLDSVFFDAASGAVTVTVAAGNIGAGSLTMTGFTGTLAGAAGLSIAANVVLGTGITFSYNGLITFVGGTAKTITTNGKTLTGSVTMDAVGATLQLLDNFNGSSATSTVTLTNGSLDLNGFMLSMRIFASDNSNIRSIIFGGGNITSTGSGTTILSGATLTNLTITGTPIFNFTYSGSTGTRTFQWGTTAGGTEANSVIANITAGSDIIALGNSKYRGVNLTGSSVTQSTGAILSMYGSFTMSATATWSASTSLSFLHTSGTAVITGAGKTFLFDMIINAVGGTVQLGDNFTLSNTSLINHIAGTLDLNGKNFTAGALSTNNANVRGITSGSGGKISLAGNGSTIIDGTNLTNLTLTGSVVVDLTYAGATGTRTVIWGSTGIAATAVDLNIKAGTDSIKFSLYVYLNNLNFTGFNGTWAAAGADIQIGGDLTLSTGMTNSNTADIYFADPGSLHQITTAGKTLNGDMFMDGPAGATARLMDDLTFSGTRGIFIDIGTFDINSKNVTAGFIGVGGSTTGTGLAFGSGHLTLTINNDAFDVTTSGSPMTTTFSAGAKISLTGTGAKYFTGAGLTYPILEQATAGSEMLIYDNNTFSDIQRVAAGDIKLENGSTQTVLALTLGSSGAFRSDFAGLPATINKTGGTVSVSNTTITDITATGGAVFNAFTSNGNVNGGNNTGWNFTPAAVSTQGLLVMFQ